MKKIFASKVDLSDNLNPVWIQSRSQPRKLSDVTRSSNSDVQRQRQQALSPSCRPRQTKTLLVSHPPLPEQKNMPASLQPQQKQQQQQQQQTKVFSVKKDEQQCLVLDDFDRIMKEDLENQLKELERKQTDKEQEEDVKKRYRLLTGSFADQLKYDDSRKLINDLQRNYMKQMEYITAWKLCEANEQEQQYMAVMKELEECERQEQRDSVKQLAKKNKCAVNKIFRKTITPLHTREQEENQHRLLTRKQKQMLQLQLSLMKQNQLKTKQIINLIESHWRDKKFYIPIRKPYYYNH